MDTLQKNISNNSITLFFSLPFYPTTRKNRFYHGHIALGIGDKVYQIFNPNLLKADFLVSIMPINEWLYNDARYWVDKKRNSESYTYVHLYGKAEVKRTAICYCSISGVDSNKIRELISYFHELNNNYSGGKLNYNFLSSNCTTFISEIFYKENWIQKGIFDNIPSVFFKKVISSWKNSGHDFDYGIISKTPDNEFKLHGFCIGLPTFDPMKHMTNWLQNILVDGQGCII